MNDHEKRLTERAALRASMDELAAELGIPRNSEPPPSVAQFVHTFGPASYKLAEQVAFDPDSLRWAALMYRFWAQQFADYAAAGDQAATEIVADVEKFLGKSAGMPHESGRANGSVADTAESEQPHASPLRGYPDRQDHHE